MGGQSTARARGLRSRCSRAVKAAYVVSMVEALPLGGQLGRGLPHSPQGLRGHTALQGKGLVPREHKIHGPGQLLGQYREGFALVVFAFQLGKVVLPRFVLAQEQRGGFREDPLELGGADLFAREPVAFAGGLFGTLHQAAVGEEVLHAGEALRVVALGRTGDRELHLAQQFVVVVDEGHIQFNGLAYARLREMILDAFPIRLVRQLLADLREVILTVGILNVGQQLGPLAHQMTAAPEQVPGGPHLRGIDVGLRQHPAAQEHGDLMGVNLVVLGFAPMNRLHIERMPQDKGDAFAGTEIREPLPGEDTRHGHHHILAVRSDSA
jgi:hypothetical protein